MVAYFIIIQPSANKPQHRACLTISETPYLNEDVCKNEFQLLYIISDLRKILKIVHLWEDRVLATRVWTRFTASYCDKYQKS